MKQTWEVGEGYQPKRATEWQQFDAAFFGKWFEVVREVNLTGNQYWRNKFGRLGQNGWIIRDVESGEQQVVGRKLISIIHYHYNAIKLPWKPRPGRRANYKKELEAEQAAQLQADIELAVATAREQLQ